MEKTKTRTENYKNNQRTDNKMSINIHLSMMALNVNGLNAPVIKHMMDDWIKKQDPAMCCLQETNFRAKNTHRLKVRE